MPWSRKARSEARAQQALDRFYHLLETAMDVGPSTAAPVAYVILSRLLQRLSPSGARHFIAQLPRYLQTALLRVPPGPNRAITARTIVEELCARFTLREATACGLLRDFFAGLRGFLDAHALGHLMFQLPEDFRPYFEPLGKFERSESAPRSRQKLRVKSQAFPHGGEIPRPYSGEGRNRSPRLEWSAVPAGTREFAIICLDLDSTRHRPWVHWLAYGIPANISHLPEGIPNQPELDLPVRLRQGRNSSNLIGYEGPLPSRGSGPHRYVFRVYAVDREIVLPPGATRHELLAELEGHVLAEGDLTGRYSRERVKKAA